jgi:hypothetical protein
LFWNELDYKGHCPAGGGHVAAGWSFYLQTELPEDPVRQMNWRKCGLCLGLFYDGFNDKGRCPGGGSHRRPQFSTTDWNMGVNHDVDPNLVGQGHQQQDWFSCGKCSVFFFGGFAEQGKCPAGGAHDRGGSWNFIIPFEDDVSPSGFGDDNVTVPADG